MNEAQRQLLRRLALSDQATLDEVTRGLDPRLVGALDDRTRSLVRLAGLVALGAEEPSLHAAVDRARGSGATDDEIMGMAECIAPILEDTMRMTSIPILMAAMDLDRQ
jgi:alkylhydroperoxidase/carboxymuconolactone decarboxylase family protein YurZ